MTDPTDPEEETPDALNDESKRTKGSKTLPVAEVDSEVIVALTDIFESETVPYKDTVSP
jgi:hypothetical protein